MTTAQERHGVTFLKSDRGALTHAVRDGIALCGARVESGTVSTSYTCPRCGSRLRTLDRVSRGTFFPAHEQ